MNIHEITEFKFHRLFSLSKTMLELSKRLSHFNCFRLFLLLYLHIFPLKNRMILIFIQINQQFDIRTLDLNCCYPL